MTNERGRLVESLVEAIPGWQVLVVQFNDGVATEMGVSASDLQCLFVLSQHGPSTPGALADLIGITTGSASRMVERLLGAQLVTRHPDPDDRRRVIVNATPRALERVARLYEPMNTGLRDRLEKLPEGTLHHMLQFFTEAEELAQNLVRSSGQSRSSMEKGAI